MSKLVLSLFLGIGLLDMAFEQEGFCVVRGPDVLWGGDIRTFRPPAGVFDGVIGGPPCQSFSPLVYLVRAQGYEVQFGNLIPEFERCVTEARPQWFVMENVPQAPQPEVDGYAIHSQTFNNRWLNEEQERKRCISFGTRDRRSLLIESELFLTPVAFKTVTSSSGGRGKQRASFVSTYGLRLQPAAHGYPSVTSSDGSGSVRMWRYKLPEACRLQGLPEDFLTDAPFTAKGKLKAIANGVPLPMGRAIARAVKRAMGYA